MAKFSVNWLPFARYTASMTLTIISLAVPERNSKQRMRKYLQDFSRVKGISVSMLASNCMLFVGTCRLKTWCLIYLVQPWVQLENAESNSRTKTENLRTEKGRSAHTAKNKLGEKLRLPLIQITQGRLHSIHQALWHNATIWSGNTSFATQKMFIQNFYKN